MRQFTATRGQGTPTVPRESTAQFGSRDPTVSPRRVLECGKFPHLWHATLEASEMSMREFRIFPKNSEIKERKPFYEFGPFRVDPVKRLLLRDGEPVSLTPKAMEILLVLVENKGEVLVKEELMERIWPDTVVEEGNLNRNISTLRKVLGESPEDHRYIVTVPGRGYRFVADTRELWDENPQRTGQEISRVSPVGRGADSLSPIGAKAALSPIPVPSTSGQRPTVRDHIWGVRLSSFWLAGIPVAVVALLVALGVGGWRDRLLKRASFGRIQSVAVLPFQNLSGDPEQEYFADGLTEALVTDLAQIRALRVVSRTSVMRYKGTRKSLPEIAGELNVDGVVEGSVLRSGGRVRITVQLIRAQKDEHLWANTYEGDPSDILALQSVVARAIVQEIRISLTPEEQARLATVRLVHPEAHESYLKGRYLWDQRTPGTLKKSIGHFEQAVQRDPHYALAYLASAEAFAVMATNEFEAPQDMVPKAKQAAEQALNLDGGLAEGYGTLAQLRFFYDWDFPGAERQFRRALELSPNYATAHQWYGLLLMYQRRFEEAFQEIKKAQELDPLSRVIRADLGLIYLYSGRYDEAIQQGRTILEIEPNFSMAHDLLGMALGQKRMYPEAIAEFQKYLILSDRDPDALMRLGSAYAVSGDKDNALKLLHELKSLPKGRYASPCYFAALETALGEKDRAFKRLERALDQRASSLLLLAVDPAFDPLRADPRFQDLLRRVGLPQ